MLGRDRHRIAEPQRIGFEPRRPRRPCLRSCWRPRSPACRTCGPDRRRRGRPASGRRAHRSGRAPRRPARSRPWSAPPCGRRGFRARRSSRPAVSITVKSRSPSRAWPFAAVARHARPVVDQREPLADQPVEQRRFADVRPADDGDGEAHGPRYRGAWRGVGPGRATTAAAARRLAADRASAPGRRLLRPAAAARLLRRRLLRRLRLLRLRGCACCAGAACGRRGGAPRAACGLGFGFGGSGGGARLRLRPAADSPAPVPAARPAARPARLPGTPRAARPAAASWCSKMLSRSNVSQPRERKRRCRAASDRSAACGRARIIGLSSCRRRRRARSASRSGCAVPAGVSASASDHVGPAAQLGGVVGAPGRQRQQRARAVAERPVGRGQRLEPRLAVSS